MTSTVVKIFSGCVGVQKNKTKKVGWRNTGREFFVEELMTKLNFEDYQRFYWDRKAFQCSLKYLTSDSFLIIDGRMNKE